MMLLSLAVEVGQLKDDIKAVFHVDGKSLQKRKNYIVVAQNIRLKKYEFANIRQ